MSLFRSFSKLLDRGKLLVPSSVGIHVTMTICQIWRQLVKNESSRFQLLSCNLPRKVFAEVVHKLAIQQDDIATVTCTDGHSLLNELLPKMSAALFNLFAGNMVKERNSDVHAKRKPTTSAATVVMRRSQSDDKRRKLTGSKNM